MLPTPIVVSGAENVTWTGETGCTPLECQIIQPSYNGTMSHSTLYCSYIVFEDCRGVSVSNLGFVSSDVSAQYPRPCDNVKLVGVEDAVLDSVMLEGRYGLGVFNASGRYKFVNSVGKKGVHFIGLFSCPSYSKNCSFSLNMTNSAFMDFRGVYIHIGKFARTEYSSISILVDNCSFTGYGHDRLALNVWNFPLHSFSTIIRNSAFRDGTHGVRLRMALPVQNWALMGMPQYRPYILLDGVSISKVYHAVHFNLRYNIYDNNSCDVQHPEIIIANSSLFDFKNSRQDRYVYVVRATIRPNNSSAYFYERCRALHSLPISHPSTILTFQGSKFYSNHVSAVVYLEGFSWHRAAFHGGNEISNNYATGLVLNDTQLEIHGYNDIHENDGGLFMTSDSLLLMANGSVLNVSHNTAEFGGGIHISYKGRNIASYEDFLHCYVYKTTCPGWCFFQFVDQNGHLLMQDEFNVHQANINLERNRAIEDGHEIFNGHLHNCSLMTKDGIIGATDALLNVMPSRVREDDALDSLPYYICLCNTSNPQNIKWWNCQQNLSLTLYPGDKHSLMVTILKDFLQTTI